jgi:hypothetical protein
MDNPADYCVILNEVKDLTIEIQMVPRRLRGSG